jgi:hypothetical protein
MSHRLLAGSQVAPSASGAKHSSAVIGSASWSPQRRSAAHFVPFWKLHACPAVTMVGATHLPAIEHDSYSKMLHQLPAALTGPSGPQSAPRGANGWQVPAVVMALFCLQ